jgi:ABC-type transporter Mla subunit MlaD
MARTLRGEVIDFAAIRRARQVENQAVDMVAAWEGRRAQLTGQAELVAREIAAHAEALEEAVARFREFGRTAIGRLGEIQRQIDDINTAIDHWRAHAPDEGG